MKLLLKHWIETAALVGVAALVVGCAGANTNGTARNDSTAAAEVGEVKPVETAGSASGYRAEFKAEPAEIKAGENVTLVFTVKDADGKVVPDLPVVHEKPMHLLVISKDLRDFFHLHPELQADGSYRVEHTFPSGGDYTLFIDYTPKGAPQVVDRIPLTVKGAPRATAALRADPTSTRTVDGLRVTMTPSKPPRPGEGVVLQFAVVDEKMGRPAANLEPYLGAMAHFVILSEDSKDFLHAHPLEEKPTGDGRVSAHTTFPRAGLYKAWVQLQRDGKVITVPFVLNVPGAPANPAPAQGHGHAHH
jgi:hypothetical protein